MSGKSASAFRRTKRTAIAVGAVVALTVAATDPGAAAPTQEAPFNKGTGTAQANSIQVDPVAGGLSFGVGIGQALAGHQNTVGQAESRAFDLGVIGVTLAGEGCDGGDPTLPDESQPQPERISSTDEGSEQGHSSGEAFAGGQISKSVRASDDPMAEAVTVAAPFDIPGLLHVGATRALARSQVLASGVRQATAITEISDMSLGGDAVKMRGLRWEAIHRTGAVNETIGTFTVEALMVAGVPYQPVDDLTQLNAVLNPLGFTLRAPRTRTVNTTGGTIVVVDPLSVAVIPNATRDALLGDLLAALQAVREPLADALIDADCGNATYVTILDVVIASVTGGGTLSVSLGGVRASTAAIKLFEGLGQLLPLPPLPPALPTPAIPGLPGRPAVPGTPGTRTPATSASEDDASGPIERVVDTDGERGGAMAMVGLGGLLMLVAVAEADRRKMRSAQRSVPLEV